MAKFFYQSLHVLFLFEFALFCEINSLLYICQVGSSLKNARVWPAFRSAQNNVMPEKRSLADLSWEIQSRVLPCIARTYITLEPQLLDFFLTRITCHWLETFPYSLPSSLDMTRNNLFTYARWCRQKMSPSKWPNYQILGLYICEIWLLTRATDLTFDSRVYYFTEIARYLVLFELSSLCSYYTQYSELLQDSVMHNIFFILEKCKAYYVEIREDYILWCTRINYTNISGY